MPSRFIEDPWRGRMLQRGLTTATGRPSLSALARESRLAVETVRRAVYGIGEPTPATVQQLVGVLGDDVQDWLGRHVVDGPWQPPAVSAYLTGEQRAVLDQLVRVMTDANAAPVRPPVGAHTFFGAGDDGEMSDPAGTDVHLIAAHDEDGSISGEQEQPDTP